eukprot:m.92141 g.92141  ORF g.92141 m.92141 type:complete len:847 (-) comp13339_c0_seq3:19-2559(-)
MTLSGVIFGSVLLVNLLHVACLDIENTCNVLERGAKGDGVSLDTAAIQSTLDSCSVIIFPTGHVFLTGPLNISSHVTLHLDPNSTLRASDDFDLYHWIAPIPSYMLVRVHPVLRAVQAVDVTITGGGVLDGNGRKWAQYFNNNTRHGYNATVSMRRPFFVSFENCSDVTIQNITVMNSPHWTLHMWNSENILISGVTMRTIPRLGCPDGRCYPNSDGIDIDSSRNVVIQDCDIDTNDDSVALKSGVGAPGFAFAVPTTNVTIDRCFFHPPYGNSVRIGTESVGGVHNITIRNSVFQEKGFGLSSCNDNTNLNGNISLYNITFNNSYIDISPQLGNSELCHASKATSNHNVSLKGYEFQNLKGTVQYLKLNPESQGVFSLNLNNVNFNATSWSCSNIEAGEIQTSGSIHPPLDGECLGDRRLITPNEINTPQIVEVHIAIGDTPDSMTLTWATMNDTGTPMAKVTKVDSTSVLFTGSTQLFQPGPNRTIYLHTVRATSLELGANYSYTLSHNESSVSYNGTFNTYKSGPLRVVFFGDTGHSTAWSNGTVPSIASHVRQGLVDVVLHTGDMAYYANKDDGWFGDIHTQELSDLTQASVPLMVCPGNADVFCYRPDNTTPPWGKCMLEYQSRYIMPGWNSFHSLWSTFRMGLTQFVMLDSEALLWCNGSQNHTQQRQFMQTVFAAARKEQVSWLVVVVHRPLYSSFNSTDEQLRMREGFADLFEEYKVDFVLHGHVHSYERMYPVTGNYTVTSNATVNMNEMRKDNNGNDVYVSPTKPIYIVSGAAGNGESIDKFTGDTYNWTFSAFQSVDVGYSWLNVHNSTHAQVSFFSVSQNKTIDTAMIVKGNKH